MGINSKKKGSRNERKLAKVWQAFTGYEFTRTPGSGGLRWQRTTDTVGDLVCTDKKHSRFFRFSIEAKVYKEINFEHLISGGNAKILEFWEQAKEDGVRSKKVPLLFMRYNNMPSETYYLVMSLEFFEYIEEEIVITKGLLKYTKDSEDFVILNSTDFFKASYLAIHKLAKYFIKTEA